MFIDYITLLLVNMAAAFFLLAGYVYRGIASAEQKAWALGFGVSGVIAVLFGAHMTMTWPVIGPYNSLFGEMSVLLGILLVGAAVGTGRGWPLHVLGWYAFFAGAAAILLGVRIAGLELTGRPDLTAVGFILSGLGGVFAAPLLIWFREVGWFRAIAALVLVAAGLIWVVTAYPSYWMHMESFGKWLPATMRAASGT